MEQNLIYENSLNRGGVQKPISHTITAYVPGNQCNFRCEYCYISNSLDPMHNAPAHFNYPVEHMVTAFNPNRIGIAAINVIGAGETLIPNEVVPFVHGLLRQGHYVTVITNLSLTERIKQLLSIKNEPSGAEYLSRLCVKGSLHWVELKKRKLIDTFFDNINAIIDAGASAYPSLVICNEYMPYLEKIREVSLKKIGALPHCSPNTKTLEQGKGISRTLGFTTEPLCDENLVKKIREMFDSPTFDLAIQFLPIDPKKIFCYAGAYGYGVELGTGTLLKCHNFPIAENFFQDINNPPCNVGKMNNVIANLCGISSCMLQFDFLAEGFIPEVPNVPNLADVMIKNRERLFNKKFIDAFRFKFPAMYGVFTPESERAILMDNSISLINANTNLQNEKRQLLNNYVEYFNKMKPFFS